jgi:hypothetical protein
MGGTWSRSFAQSGPPFGVTYVLQVDGYDGSYPGLDAYSISNAIPLSL